MILVFLCVVFLQLSFPGCICSPSNEKGDLIRRFSIAKRSRYGLTWHENCWGDECALKDVEMWNGEASCRGSSPRCKARTFDFNNFETIHCHTCSCFPSTARVSLESGKTVKMSELQIGDRVQTGNSHGSLTYSEIKVFMKRQPTDITMYKSITTSSNQTINISGNHKINRRKSATDKFNPVYADQISVGNEVLVEGYQYFEPEKVIYISMFAMQGAFTPVTEEGNIMVDGVLASCYASADHDMAHIVMTPDGFLM